MIAVKRELEDPAIWSQPERTQVLGRERAQLENTVNMVDSLVMLLHYTEELHRLAFTENDTDVLASITQDLTDVAKKIEALEFQRMFSGEMDAQAAYMDIQAGSGGTEAQDWAEMLLRMYLRWGERHGFSTEMIEASPGEVAGIKSATVKFDGPYAYGWLRTESGVHRLVRKSPFDANHKRHTSFASVFISPTIYQNISI